MTLDSDISVLHYMNVKGKKDKNLTFFVNLYIRVETQTPLNKNKESLTNLFSKKTNSSVRVISFVSLS